VGGKSRPPTLAYVPSPPLCMVILLSPLGRSRQGGRLQGSVGEKIPGWGINKKQLEAAENYTPRRIFFAITD
jgi:hypothetical protein